MKKLLLVVAIVTTCGCSDGKDSKHELPPTSSSTLPVPANIVTVLNVAESSFVAPASSVGSISSDVSASVVNVSSVVAESQPAKPAYRIDDLIKQAQMVAPKKTSFVDSKLVALSGGDLVKPTFSPNSTKLAYSNVVLVDKEGGKQELAEVLIFDTKTKSRLKVISKEQSLRYAVYGTFVTSMNWPSETQLLVHFADGDVDGTDVLIETLSGKTISEEGVSAGLDEDDISRTKDRVEDLLSKFPNWQSNVLASSLSNNSLTIQDQLIILQRFYHGYNNDILLLDVKNNQEQTLIQMRDSDRRALIGGLVLNGEAIFALQMDEGVGLFRLTRQQTIIPLALIARTKNMMSLPLLVAKYVSQKDAMFMLRLSSSPGSVSNPIFYYSPDKGLIELTDFSNVYEFDVTKDRQLIAVSYLENKRRRIDIGHLNQSEISK